MTILAKPKMPRANRDTPLVDKIATFNKVFAFLINMERIGKILRAKVTTWPSFTYQFSSNCVCICCFSRSRLISFPISNFDDLGVSRKPVIPIFQWHRVCKNWSWDRLTIASRAGAFKVISLTTNCFLYEILAKLEMLLANRDNKIVGEHG